MLVDQAMPLLAGAKEEEPAKNNGEQPEKEERTAFPVFQRFGRKVHREAAGEQAHGEEPRNLKHFARRRPRKTFADIKKIGNHEDGEDRGLSDDEASHR